MNTDEVVREFFAGRPPLDRLLFAALKHRLFLAFLLVGKLSLPPQEVLGLRWPMVNLVEGEGVVGEQPVLHPGQSHDYVSGCPLTTPMGAMQGHYGFRREDGSRFEVAIPHFPLAAPATAG